MAQHPLTAAADYLLSLPERVVRSASAVAGGLVRELSDVSIPPRIRRTSLYTNLVENTLRFMIEQVGQVPDAYPTQGNLADDFALRRIGLLPRACGSGPLTGHRRGRGLSAASVCSSRFCCSQPAAVRGQLPARRARDGRGDPLRPG